MRSLRFRRSSIANELGDVADLLPEEQSELATKLRFGIGLEQLLGDGAHRPPVTPLRATVAPPPEMPRDPAATARAVARLGRGHGLGRTWRR